MGLWETLTQSIRELNPEWNTPSTTTPANGLLAAVYSGSDSLKRRVKGLLADPVGEVQLANIRAAEDAKKQDIRRQQMLANPQSITPDQVAEAMNTATSFAPLGMFMGVDSPAANLSALAQARRMMVSGATPEEVWAKTGWGIDPAKQWTFETSDHLANVDMSHPMRYLTDMSPMGKATTTAQMQEMGDNYNKMLDIVRNSGAANGKLSSMLNHDELYAAHPDSKGYRVEFKNLGVPYGASWGNGLIEMGNGFLGQADDGVRAVLHEIQHSVQDKYGRSRGADPSEFKGVSDKEALKMYNKVYGEAEARQTATRWKMTPEERRQSYPWNPDTFKLQTVDQFGRNGVDLPSLLFLSQ